MSLSPHAASAKATDPAQPVSVLDRSGLVVIDKPAGMTSHDVVAQLRRVYGTRRVGHSGTLDPMATGVLVVGVERGTKFLAHVVTHDKRYEATVRLGQATVTDDCEGKVLTTAAAELLHGERAISDAAITEALAAQRGVIMQRPTKVSSIKINGRRAHELVREGVEFEIPAREVTVFELSIGKITRGTTDAGVAYIDVPIAVHCSSGTYIRAIARDVGEALGVGGHLTTLRRTSVGPFDIAEARPLEALKNAPQAELTLSLDEAMVRCFPTREISAGEAQKLAIGQWLEPIGNSEVYAAQTADGRAVALVKEKGKRAASVFVARPSTLA